MSGQRTVGRQATNGLPTWAQYTDSLTLHPFANAPSTLTSLITWPGGGAAIPNLDGGTDGAPEAQHAGWGSAWFLRDVGTHGAFAFRRTGEFSQENQISLLPLSADSPAWEWWQQPFCCLNETEAAAADADYFYNLSLWNSIVTNHPNRAIDYSGSSAWATSWDGVFPVAMPAGWGTGWIIRRKVRNGSYGNNITSRARYDSHCTIPASWTKTGAAAIVVNPQTLGGPWQNWQGQAPNIPSKAAWFEQVGASGERRSYLNFQNLTTKAWSFATTAIPDSLNFFGAPSGPVFKDVHRKRLYWIIQNNTGLCYWWADFSAGISGMTVGGPTNFSGLSGANFSDAAPAGCTEGHPQGRRLMYWTANQPDAANHLYVFDLDSSSLGRVNLTGKLNWATPYTNPRIGFEYLPDTNTMVILEHYTDGYYVHRFVVPADPLDAASYTIQRDTLTLGSGASISSLAKWYFGEQFVSVPTLRDSAGRHLFVVVRVSGQPMTFRMA